MKKKIVGGSTAMISSFTFANSLLMAFQDEMSRTMRHVTARAAQRRRDDSGSVNADSFYRRIGYSSIGLWSNNGNNQRLYGVGFQVSGFRCSCISALKLKPEPRHLATYPTRHSCFFTRPPSLFHSASRADRHSLLLHPLSDTGLPRKKKRQNGVDHDGGP